MNTIENYDLENELNMPIDLDTDWIQIENLFRTEYYNGNIFDPPFTADELVSQLPCELEEDLENLLLYVKNESTEKRTILSEEILLSNNRDGQHTPSKSSLENAEGPAATTTALDKTSPSGVHLPHLEKSFESSSTEDNDDEEEVKDNTCHFVPNPSSHVKQSQKQKKECDFYQLSSPEIDSIKCNGSIADLVKTRKRTCRNGYVNDNVTVKRNIKNSPSSKREQTLKKNASGRVVSKTPSSSSSSKNMLHANSSKEIVSTKVPKLKKEPKEHILSLEVHKYHNKKNSSSKNLPCDGNLGCIFDKSQNLNGKFSNSKSNFRERTKIVNIESSVSSVDGIEGLNYQLSNSSQNPFQQNLLHCKQTKLDAKKNCILNQEEQPIVSAAYSQNNSYLSSPKNSEMSISSPLSDVSNPSCSKQLESAENQNRLKLRISRCANNFTSCVIPTNDVSETPVKCETIVKEEVLSSESNSATIQVYENVNETDLEKKSDGTLLNFESVLASSCNVLGDKLGPCDSSTFKSVVQHSDARDVISCGMLNFAPINQNKTWPERGPGAEHQNNFVFDIKREPREICEDDISACSESQLSKMGVFKDSNISLMKSDMNQSKTVFEENLGNVPILHLNEPIYDVKGFTKCHAVFTSEVVPHNVNPALVEQSPDNLNEIDSEKQFGEALSFKSSLFSSSSTISPNSKTISTESPCIHITEPIHEFSKCEEHFDSTTLSCSLMSSSQDDTLSISPKISAPISSSEATASQGCLASSLGAIVNIENPCSKFSPATKCNIKQESPPKLFVADLENLSSDFVKDIADEIVITSQNKGNSPKAKVLSQEIPCNKTVNEYRVMKKHLEALEASHNKINPVGSVQCTKSLKEPIEMAYYVNREDSQLSGEQGIRTTSLLSSLLINSVQSRDAMPYNDKGPKESPTLSQNSSKQNNSTDNGELSNIQRKFPLSRSGTRQYRKRSRSFSIESSDSDSYVSVRRSRKYVFFNRSRKYVFFNRSRKYVSRRSSSRESSRKRSYHSKCRKSPSKTSYTESRSGSRSSHSSRYRGRSRSPSESFRKTKRRKRCSSRSWSRHRKPYYSSRSRSRSPSPRERKDSFYERSRSARKHACLEEQEKQTDERRVVYVGQIPDDFTVSELRDRFRRFGYIEDINIHRRNARRDNNFGFVTFRHTEDACAAIARGNDPPLKPRFDISFGGRRLFCRQRYSDLDKEKELMENNEYYHVPPKMNDFDSLLKAELRRTGLRERKC